MSADITLVSLSLGYRGHGSLNTEKYVPLGPLYLVSALEQAGFRVDFRDFQQNACKEHALDSSSFKVSSSSGRLLKDVAAFLDDPAPVLGMSCMSDLLPLAVLAAELVKEQSPETMVVLGGIGPAGVAEELMNQFPFLDVATCGEGEVSIVDLMRRIAGGANLEIVEGITLRHGRRVMRTPQRPAIEDVDGILFPAYHKIDFNRYSVPGILTSRGCPFECTFCDVSPFWGRSNRPRSIGNVMAEIRLLRERYNLEFVELVDDTFTLDKRRVLEFCKRMKEEMAAVRWSCCARVDCIDREMMQAMAGSGCRMIAYGVESGSDRVLQHLKKGFSTADIMDVLRVSRQYFPQVIAYCMWGFPFETMADFGETVDFIFRIIKMGIQPWLFSLSPLPLSRIYREYHGNLMFSEEFCSNYLGILREEPEVVELIRSYPQVFPGFYFVDPRFPLKYSMAQEFQLPGMPAVTGMMPAEPEGCS